MATRQPPTTRPTRQAKPPKPMSATARKTLATKQLVSTLGSDEKAVVTAALEILNERLSWDTGLLLNLRQRYDELAALNIPKPKIVRDEMFRVDGSGPSRRATLEKLDPYQLLEDVGRDRLRAALAGNTQKAPPKCSRHSAGA